MVCFYQRYRVKKYYQMTRSQLFDNTFLIYISIKMIQFYIGLYQGKRHAEFCKFNIKYKENIK